MGSNVSSRANSVHSGSLKTYEDGSGRHPLQAELEASVERLHEMNALNQLEAKARLATINVIITK